MRLSDPALPAVQHLVGEGAIDVLRLPVEATGGVVESVRPVQVQYRPGSDVVVRYSAQVSWHGGQPVRETLVASSTVYGAHPGAVPITADTASGPIEIGVWRWPFDPVLTGLGDVVTARGAAELLGGRDDEVGVEIVAYRPTDRAVVRVSIDDEPVAYIKVVAPDRTDAVARRHDALTAGGVPAAPIRALDRERGLLALGALHGPTFRELIKSNAPEWPSVDEFVRLSDALATVAIDGPGPASRLTDGVLHARMLAVVVPESGPLLDDLASRFEHHGVPAVDGTVHGDLHEGQVIVDRGRIVGLLDVDDVGPGASIDDLANLIARIRFRGATMSGSSARVGAYAGRLRDACLGRFDAHHLDVHTAAAIVGLATGPFRIQSDGWRSTVARLLDLASDLSMRELSA